MFPVVKQHRVCMSPLQMSPLVILQFYFMLPLLGSEPRLGSFFGRGRGPIFLENVNCIGTELRLTNCTNSGVGMRDCSHLDDAGVVCSGIQHNVCWSNLGLKFLQCMYYHV